MSPVALEGTASKPAPATKHAEFSVDEYRAIKVCPVYVLMMPQLILAAPALQVICIGAGIAGIVAGIRCAGSVLRYEDIELISAFSFRQRVPNLDLTIYEKEDGIGGTWHASRYPVRAIVSSFPGC